MKSRNKYPGVNPFIVSTVRSCAKYMKSLKCYAHDEIEDVEQDIFCEILPCLQQYDKNKSSISYFMKNVIKHRIINLINKKQRMKYGGDLLFVDNDTLDSLIDENCNFHDEIAARFDVDNAIKQLPQRLQDLCKKLKDYNVEEVSEITGLSRTTIYKIIRKIGRKFPHLKSYLS